MTEYERVMWWATVRIRAAKVLMFLVWSLAIGIVVAAAHYLGGRP